jgi:hypothetical protein
VFFLVLGGLATSYLALTMVTDRFGGSGVFDGISHLLNKAPEHFHMILNKDLGPDGKLLNPKYKIDICNHMNKYMSETEAKDAYKFIINNNRGYNMLFDLIKKEYNIIPQEFMMH